MKRLGLLLALVGALVLTPALVASPAAPGPAGQPEQPDPKAVAARLRQIASQLHPQTGDVRIPAANAILRLGQDYYFLPAAEARLVLTEAWGNPPETASNVLGMVFPAGRTFVDDTWGAVITYEATGYVGDSDAESTDYQALLTQLQAGEAEINNSRAARGYPAQHLVGWAQPPVYDRSTHSVIWAQNLQVAGSDENTLNYDIRMLGRRGVLSLNMVTSMSKLAETRQAARRFLAAVQFAPGERYADYQPGTDRVADYGVAGLVAAGVGATVAQKAGLFVVILAFLKKAGIFIIAGIALLWGAIRRFLGRKEEEDYYDEAQPVHYTAEPEAGPAPAEAPAAEAPPPNR